MDGTLISLAKTAFESLWGRREDQKMWTLHQTLCALQERNPARLIFRPKPEERKYYERMVERGLLVRDLPRMYYLAGR